MIKSISPLEAVLKNLLSKHPPGFKLGLERIEVLLKKLGNPHLKLPPIIHVAGTNGKGSICAFSQALLEAAGYRAHVHNSPHLVNWHERFRLAATDNTAPLQKKSHFVDDTLLAQTLNDIDIMNGEDSITVFEMLTAAAFVLFSQFPADAVILEVGLGGRFDATNIIQNPACSVISPIAYDHEKFLGDDIQKIALEKAGIIKKNCPLIIGQQIFEEALAILMTYATKQNAPFLAYGQDFYSFIEHDRMIFQDQNQLFDLPLPKLKGQHQIENAATALMAVRQAGFVIPEKAIELAWQNVYWPARLEKLNTGTLPSLFSKKSYEIWLDGSHNPHAALQLKHNIDNLQHKNPLPLTFIIGMLDTKNSQDYLKNLASLDAEFIFVPIQDHEHSLKPEFLMDSAQALGLNASVEQNLTQALKKQVFNDKTNGRIFITGSLYLCGEALKLNNTPPL